MMESHRFKQYLISRKPTLRSIARRLLPKWVADDLVDRIAHPYYLRCNYDAGCQPVESQEKFSDRVPFKKVSEPDILRALRNDKARRILDVGCGRGNLVRHLNSLGFLAWGITINSAEVERKADDKVLCGDITENASLSGLPEIKFDAIVSLDCVEHLQNPIAGLRNINNLLKEGGLFVSYLPPSRWTECSYHVVVYTPRQYRWLLNQCGFDLFKKNGRHYFSNLGTTYYAHKATSHGSVYPGRIE